MPDITFLRSNSLENGKQVLCNAEQQCDSMFTSDRNLKIVPEICETVRDSPYYAASSNGVISSRPLFVQTNLSPTTSQMGSPMRSSEYAYQMSPYQVVSGQPPFMNYQLVQVPIYYASPPAPVLPQMPPPSICFIMNYLQRSFLSFESGFKHQFSQFWERYQSNWDMNEVRSPPADRSRWMIHQYEAPVHHICKQCGVEVQNEKSKINFWYCFNWSKKAGQLCYKTYNKPCGNCRSSDCLVPIWNDLLVDKAMATVSSAVSQNIYGKRHYPKSRKSSRASSISPPQSE